MPGDVRASAVALDAVPVQRGGSRCCAGRAWWSLDAAPVERGGVWTQRWWSVVGSLQHG